MHHANGNKHSPNEIDAGLAVSIGIGSALVLLGAAPTLLNKDMGIPE